ncbi:NAD-dependent epimerase/dehydratase family protein [Pseudoroseomonas ludipueritiae]|uniref:NAD-dependent epimerase/dehydratase family protein n=1 Tax=Pseudoroseomonas ludipueritiae TaxID=198093 RepID=A0ABR7R5B4_9PROT|nr:NAD-dependent epimerase/dehydratase family protein [Pseudoroseomonas ludipueritiae]MBC9176944.1 NAD-dependent epimerase/dehydratase family protein [Pseudoroseomonas ludipueritiae]
MTHARMLVTGGNGYVGRQLTRRLCQSGEVGVADNLRYGPWRFTPEERTQLQLFRCDIRQSEEVEGLMEDFAPDVTVHLAALHYIPECEDHPKLAVDTNVLGTLNLLLACPPGSRFVLASTGAVYRPDERPHHEEESAVGPSDIYGFSKLHAENYVRMIAAKRGLRAVIVRLFNVVGPGETNPHLLPEIMAQLKSGRRVIDLGNLSPQRDYISVEDAARGFEAAALGNAVEPGETVVVNLGTSQTYSVAEVVEKLRQVSGIDFEIRQDESRIRKVDRPVLRADNRRIGELFGWRPQQTLDEVLAQMWQNADLARWLTERYQSKVVT